MREKRGGGDHGPADSDGRVDAAVYSRPHVIDETTVAFIMADRLTHRNLTTNPHAVYLFRESRPGYFGKRLYLTKLEEEQDSPLINELRRKKHGHEGDAPRTRFLVYFRINRIRALAGSDPASGET